MHDPVRTVCSVPYSSLDCHTFMGLWPTKSKNVFATPPPGSTSTFLSSMRTHLALTPSGATRNSIVWQDGVKAGMERQKAAHVRL